MTSMSQSVPATGDVALVFPGQGAQCKGMARDFCEQFPASRRVFEEASDALSFDVEKLCFEDDARLHETEYTQPALLTAEMAMVGALSQEFGIVARVFGGHSLGEYTALCAAGVFTVRDAVRLVKRRGELMQAAVPQGVGAMTAVISSGIGLRPLDALLGNLTVDVANHNSFDQVVLSGEAADVEQAAQRLRALLHDVEHRIVPLQVSAPFHSRMIKVIEAELRQVLEEAAPRFVCERAAFVTSNHSGGFHEPQREVIVSRLVSQAFSRVAWIDNMRALSGMAGRIYEVGPGRALRGFFKATLGVEVSVVGNVRALRREILL